MHSMNEVARALNDPETPPAVQRLLDEWGIPYAKEHREAAHKIMPITAAIMRVLFGNKNTGIRDRKSVV